MGSPPDSGDELPFSPVTRATAIGLVCGVVLVGLFAVRLEPLLGGRAWWYLPVPGAVVGILGAVLNRAHLPSDSPLTTVRTVHRRTLTAAVTPLVVLAGGGVLLAVWALANFEQLAGDIWDLGAPGLLFDVVVLLLLLAAIVALLVALAIVLAVIGAVGTASTAVTYLTVWKLLSADPSRQESPPESPPPSN